LIGVVGVTILEFQDSKGSNKRISLLNTMGRVAIEGDSPVKKRNSLP